MQCPSRRSDRCRPPPAGVPRSGWIIVRSALPRPAPWVMGQSWLDLLFAHWPRSTREDAAERSPERHPNRHLRRIRVDRYHAVRDRRRPPARASPAAVALPVPGAQRAYLHDDRRTPGYLVLQPGRRPCRHGRRRTPPLFDSPTGTRTWRSHDRGRRIHYRSRAPDGRAPPSARATSPLDRRATPRTGPSSIS